MRLFKELNNKERLTIELLVPLIYSIREGAEEMVVHHSLTKKNAKCLLSIISEADAFFACLLHWQLLEEGFISEKCHRKDYAVAVMEFKELFQGEVARASIATSRTIYSVLISVAGIINLEIKRLEAPAREAKTMSKRSVVGMAPKPKTIEGYSKVNQKFKEEDVHALSYTELLRKDSEFKSRVDGHLGFRFPAPDFGSNFHFE